MRDLRVSPICRDSGQSGFTLLEALTALVLMGVLLATLGAITAQWMPSWKAGFARAQGADLLGLSLDRITADLAAAEYETSGGEGAALLFDGSPASVTFVRSAIGPNASAGLEIIRLGETEDARGLLLVRSRAPFAPGVTSEDLNSDTGDSDAVEFTNPVVLLRPPFQAVFAFAGPDRIWQETWHDPQRLPAAIRVTIQNGDEILAASTATLLHVNAPAECVRSKVPTCAGLGQSKGGPGGDAGPDRPGGGPGQAPQPQAVTSPL